jgi:hypothetical protein
VVATPEAYIYDAHGNITSMPHLSLMTWDWKNQLGATAQQILHDGTPETTYHRYDAGGERALRATETQNGALTAQRLYLSGYEVYREHSSAGAITLERETLHISDGTTRICRDEAGAPEVRVSSFARIHPIQAELARVGAEAE